MSTSFRVGSLDSSKDVDEAVKIVRRGGVVIAQFRSVFGVWVRADDAEAVERALVNVKEGDIKPMVSMMTSRTFLEMVDVGKVHPSLRSLVRDPVEFEKRLAAIAIVGAPIKREFALDIPNTLLSEHNGVHKLFNLDPTGNPHMTGFIEALVNTGVLYVGISSLNASNEKEITELTEAVSFVSNKPESKLLLTDPLGVRGGVRGSFSIIDLEKATAIREGHIPIWVIENALGVRLDRSSMKSPNYPHHEDFLRLERDKHMHHAPHAWRNLALDVVGDRVSV